MTVALCMLLAACSQSLTNWNRTASSGAKAPGKDGLIKPRIVENATQVKDKLIRPSEAEFKADDKGKTTRSDPLASQKAEIGASEKTVPAASQKIAGTSEETDKRQTVEKTIPDTSPRPSDSAQLALKDETLKSPSKSEPAKEEPLRKFDHGKYLDQIHTKAKEVVNKEQNCSHAVLCRDSITEEWSLSVYRVKDHHFTSAVFVWDDIDEKWEEALVSPEKRPLPQLKEHLKISAVGKECKPLKGTMP
jgi:hypothetical protein